jgi:hypothetical protein
MVRVKEGNMEDGIQEERRRSRPDLVRHAVLKHEG